ncbi:scavenger receptor cysteine-rich type 1 protein M130-like [Mya arenaria]|uniref:scavenger receptor cysteine-rich type 1 protein M130-like n=1 Tax=Mya arenaria TaxID=6604 RepID=UPI0022E2E251|nr:scavenger receptor cysteine-rich type 1 protein M130-like [Mya arenaria]
MKHVHCRSHPSVMRSLGHEYNTADMPIWMNSVECRGLERYISECDHEPWGQHDCTHDEDVDRGAPEETAAVRLTGGSSPKAGRLEVYHSHQWGSVCDDGVTYNLARVVCSQLGYHTSHPTLTPYHSNEYTTADMPIWLDSVLCRGLERHISECYHEPWGQHDCTHDEDVGINCSDPEESDSSSTGSTSTVGILLGVFIPIGIITAVIIICKCRKKRGETTQAGRHQQSQEQFTPYQLRQMTNVAYASSSRDDAVRGNVPLGDTRTAVSSNPPEYHSISFNRGIPLNSLSHNGQTNNGYLSESSHAQEHNATDLTETPELPSYEDAMSNPDVFKIHM